MQGEEDGLGMMRAGGTQTTQNCNGVGWDMSGVPEIRWTEAVF